MSFVYVPLDSPLVNSGFRYFLCLLFPPTTLLLGLNSFIAFEKEFTPLDNRIGLDVAQLNIRNMIVLLFASFIFYILLSFFLIVFSLEKNKIIMKKIIEVIMEKILHHFLIVVINLII